MNKYVNEVYFDKIRFILDNLNSLDLSGDELVVVLLIVLLKEKNEVVDINNIVSNSQLSEKQVDDIITLLAGKYYLEIKVVDGSVDFDLSKLFKLEKINNNEVASIFKIFEDEFKRLLTQRELVRINEWLEVYSKEEIINALRKSSINDGLNFNYINKVLEND